MGYKSPMMEPGNLELGTYNIQECVRLHTNSSRVETFKNYFWEFNFREVGFWNLKIFYI